MISKIENRLSNSISNFQYYKLASNNKFNALNALIICGDPRGGTTWLSELISSIPNTEIIWEPLWISREKTFRNLGFSYRQYIPENMEWSEAKDAFSKLFSGKILNNYLCQNSSPDKIQKGERLIFKFCRATQLLPWLTNNFSFKYAPVYLVRHPCAVIASQLKQGGWDHIPSNFEIPETRYNEYYKQHEDFLRTINTKEKRLAATWCLSNSIPLNHKNNNKNWITITYESLLIEKEIQFKRIEERWNIKFPEDLTNDLHKPSSTTVEGSPVLMNYRDQISYWTKELSDRQMADIYEVLAYFNINLYNQDIMPTMNFE